MLCGQLHRSIHWLLPDLVNYTVELQVFHKGISLCSLADRMSRHSFLSSQLETVAGFGKGQQILNALDGDVHMALLSHLSNGHGNIMLADCYLYVIAKGYYRLFCVCVCVWERERARKRTERQTPLVIGYSDRCTLVISRPWNRSVSSSEHTVPTRCGRSLVFWCKWYICVLDKNRHNATQLPLWWFML